MWHICDRRARLVFSFASFVICFDVVLLAYSKAVVCSGREEYQTKRMKPLIDAATAVDLASQNCINICDLGINCATFLTCTTCVPDIDTAVCIHQVTYRAASVRRDPQSPESD
jgi:hypothetical protein